MAANRIKGITVEIGGDTTKLQTALKGVNGEIRDTQTQLKDVDKLLKLDPGNTELLAQKHRLLGDAVAETKEKLATLKTAAEQANIALANGEISQAQYDGLQREIIETEQALQSLEQQAGQSSMAVQKIAAVGETIKSAGEKITSVGEKMLPATAAVMGLGTAAVTTATGFDSAMSQVALVSGASGKALEALRDKAKEMGSKTKFSASEAAEAMNYMAMAGWKTKDMISGIDGVMNLAAASGEDLATTSDIVTDAMTAFGMKANESNRFANVLAAASSNANTNVGMMGETFKYVAPVAGSMGYSIEDSAIAIGLMANNGIKASQGGTALRSIITRLATDAGATTKKLGALGTLTEELGVEFYNIDGSARNLNDVLSDARVAWQGLTQEQQSNYGKVIAGQEALSGWLALMNSSPKDIEKVTNAIINCDGAAEKMANIQIDNLEGQFTILQSALEGLAISFGELLMPAIQQIVEWVQAFVDKLNGLDEGVKKNIITIGLIIAAIGPVLIMIGKVVSAVGTIMTIVPKVASAIGMVKKAFTALGTAMLANPIAMIITSITALVAAFIYLWNTNEEFRQFWINLWDTIKEVAVTVWNTMKEFFTTAWEAISETAKTIWNGIKEFFSTLWKSIKNIFTTIVISIKDFLTNAWNGIKTVVTTVMNAIKMVFTTIWNAIKTVVITVWNIMKTLITTYINGWKTIITTVMNAIKMVFTTVWNAIKTVVTTVWNIMETLITTYINGWKTIITTVMNAIKMVFTTVWNAIKTVVTTVINSIKNTIFTVWNQIKTTISSVMNNIKTSVGTAFKTMWNGIKTTVSGIYNTIKDGFNKAVDFIKGLASSAFDWGADIIGGIVSGIKSCISNITDAVSNVAETIKSYLHFSVPDVGPLTDYESWMPDFMQGLAKGIEQSRSVVAQAIKGVASDMVIHPIINTASVETFGNSLENGMESTKSYEYGSSPLIEIQEMIVRNEDDIRRVSQELNTLLQAGRRAKGKI